MKKKLPRKAKKKADILRPRRAKYTPTSELKEGVEYLMNLMTLGVQIFDIAKEVTTPPPTTTVGRSSDTIDGEAEVISSTIKTP